MFATIGASFHKGWRAGPSIFMGHALVECILFMLILIGASSFLRQSIISYLSIVGGFVMVAFGLLMIKKAKEASTMDVSISASSLNLSSGFHVFRDHNLSLKPFFEHGLSRNYNFSVESFLCCLVVDSRQCNYSSGISGRHSFSPCIYYRALDSRLWFSSNRLILFFQRNGNNFTAHTPEAGIPVRRIYVIHRPVVYD